LLSRGPKRSGLPKFRVVTDTTSFRFRPSARRTAGWSISSAPDKAANAASRSISSSTNQAERPQRSVSAPVDHIAQVVPGGQLDTWTLFNRAILGLMPVSSTELNDPYGVIRSRALETPDRAVRYALNVSQRDSTSTARTIASFGGAGVHHVAFKVGDVVATARALRELGAPLLPIPANYYDDLAAKYDLDAGWLAELMEFGIFYDRNADGEYLNFYTTPFEDRFFFEFVEHRGAYHDYGIVNVPVRLAALAQWRMSNGNSASARPKQTVRGGAG
jgi:4-hydroxyphenylpyruvate dioxygenase